jgi:protoheme IX farnesyltransferase
LIKKQKYNTDSLTAGQEPFLIAAADKINLLFELVKVRITVLVSFTTVLGCFLASENPGFGFIYPVAGIFLLACSSAALNQFQEQKTDVLMERTKNRPIPSGRISGTLVLAISSVLLLSGSALLYFGANVPSLLTGLLTYFWYNGLYTPLKKKTALAIIPGSLVGALPPVAGWLAAGGSISDIRIIVVAAYFFVWQIPHFWLLLLMYGDDFRKGGFPVLTDKYSAEFIKKITFVLLAATVTMGASMPLFGIGSYVLSAALVYSASLLMFYVSFAFYFSRQLPRKEIVRTFVSINLYTLILITIYSADKLFYLL